MFIAVLQVEGVVYMFVVWPAIGSDELVWKMLL